MKLKQLLTLATFITVSFSQSLFADTVRVGYPVIGGNGCPEGTVYATLTPDRKALLILFDAFLVAAGGSSPRMVARKSCNFVIPLHIPQAISVSITRAEYRGFVDIPNVAGASAKFSAEFFFAGERGPIIQRTFRKGYSDDYIITKPLIETTRTWSTCGRDVNLRVNAGMMVKNRSRTFDALAIVDSGIIYRLAWRSCGSIAKIKEETIN